MEAYSSSSSSYLLGSSQEAEGMKEAKLFQSSLRSVRKSPSKPWKKPAIAPLPPTRPRVYKVDPVNFRDLVQKLTGAPEFQSPRLRKMAPPPLSVGTTVPSFTGREISASSAPWLTSPVRTPFSALYKDLMMPETSEMKPQKMIMPDWSMMSNSLGLSLSPSSYNWCTAYPLLSPGTLSSLEQSTVL